MYNSKSQKFSTHSEEVKFLYRIHTSFHALRCAVCLSACVSVSMSIEWSIIEFVSLFYGCFLVLLYTFNSIQFNSVVSPLYCSSTPNQNQAETRNCIYTQCEFLSLQCWDFAWKISTIQANLGAYVHIAWNTEITWLAMTRCVRRFLTEMKLSRKRKIGNNLFAVCIHEVHFAVSVHDVRLPRSLT